MDKTLDIKDPTCLNCRFALTIKDDPTGRECVEHCTAHSRTRLDNCKGIVAKVIKRDPGNQYCSEHEYKLD